VSQRWQWQKLESNVPTENGPNLIVVDGNVFLLPCADAVHQIASHTAMDLMAKLGSKQKQKS
jgi:hypothetical protein